MAHAKEQVLIVGGGLAGLACAIRLQERGMAPIVLEASDAVGGRVRTDLVDGFRLDRGFQVFLDSYASAGSLLNLDELRLRRFKPGALVFLRGKLHRVMDVFREPWSLLESAFAPIGSMADKARVALLRFKLRRTSVAAIDKKSAVSTEDYLRHAGFSEQMIDVFFRSFYGGIFLGRDLLTSSRMFEFTFKMFSEGHATLPALGMGEIPRQLASKLNPQAVRLNTRVAQVNENAVVLESGERISGGAVVLATDAFAAAQLMPELDAARKDWRSVTCLYFAADRSPLNEAIIALNGTGTGLVNNVCVPSDVSAEYAPERKALISVSVLGTPDAANLEARVLSELGAWFGAETRDWRHLRTERITRALPLHAASANPVDVIKRGGVVACGDYFSNASIEGAIVSGQQAANAIRPTPSQ
jgi:protoporphyrinogen oxidase